MCNMNFYCFILLEFIILLFMNNLYHVKADLVDIIGGAPADISQVPYQVSLRLQNNFMGGGIIINNRHILTAAHCVCWHYYYESECPVPAKDLSIVAGSTTLNLIDGIEIPVEKIFVYENYVATKIVIVNDIAVLRLTRQLDFTNKIQSAPLADFTPWVGTECVASGWGQTAAEGSVSNILMHVNISVIDHNSCAINVNIFHTMLCTERGIKTIWLGDSGGPLSCDGKIAGISALAHHSPLIPSIFTDVAKYRGWIDTQLKRETATTIRFNNIYYLYALIFVNVYSYILRLMYTATYPFRIILTIIFRILVWILSFFRWFFTLIF